MSAPDVWSFVERFWTERSSGRFALVFGGSAHAYKVILVKEERNNL